MILNEIDNQPRGYAEILAPIAGYAKGGGLKKPLRDEKKEFDNFNGLVNLVKFLFPNDEQKLMAEYSKTLDPCNKSARIMLEYLSCNRLLEPMKELIDKMLTCKNVESKEYAKVYEILLTWQLNYHDLDVNKILNAVEEIRTENQDLQTLLKLMKCNCYYRKRLFKMSYEISQDVELLVDSLKDEFIKNSYTVKLYEIKSYISLRVLNQPVEARKYAEKVLELNIGRTFNAYANYIIGCSYFYSSYDTAKSKFDLSIEIYKSINRSKAVDDLMEISELLDVVWDKEIFTVSYCKEYRYYWMIKNNLNINDNFINVILDEAFHYLIKGMIDNDLDSLMKSIMRFLKRGDAFLANLPRMELLKRGFSEIMIDELMNIHSIERR
jgi:hypothetical protein